MAAYVRELIDNEGNKIYPPTKASAVYMGNGKDTVARILGDQIDQNTTIEFTATTITETLASGSTVVIQFNDDGSITETTTDENGVVVQVKETVFNEDGSISITIDEEEEEE